MSGPFNIDERLNKSDKATQAEAEAGTDDSQWMSPLNVKDAYSQYGLGKTIASSEILNDTLVNGFFRYTSLDPDSDGASGAFVTFVNSPAAVHQIAFQNYTNNIRTRNKNNSDVWSDWVDFYHTGNLLGTVSQSAGEPTGSVIESGSNVNGEYIKFADGTMICSREKTYTPVTVSTTNYTILEGTTGQVDPSDLSYPAQFVSVPYASAVYYGGYAGEIVPTLESVSNSVWGGFLFLVKLTGADRSVTPTVKFFAKGRWY